VYRSLELFLIFSDQATLSCEVDRTASPVLIAIRPVAIVRPAVLSAE
jgi:hypothetical protein